MAEGYSLRKAAELAGVPTVTFHGYRNRGIIEADAEDKKAILRYILTNKSDLRKIITKKTLGAVRSLLKRETNIGLAGNFRASGTGERVCPGSDFAVAVEVVTPEASQSPADATRTVSDSDSLRRPFNLDGYSR